MIGSAQPWYMSSFPPRFLKALRSVLIALRMEARTRSTSAMSPAKSYVCQSHVAPNTHLNSESNCGSGVAPSAFQPRSPAFSLPRTEPG